MKFSGQHMKVRAEKRTEKSLKGIVDFQAAWELLVETEVFGARGRRFIPVFVSLLKPGEAVSYLDVTNSGALVHLWQEKRSVSGGDRAV